MIRKSNDGYFENDDDGVPGWKITDKGRAEILSNGGVWVRTFSERSHFVKVGSTGFLDDVELCKMERRPANQEPYFDAHAYACKNCISRGGQPFALKRYETQ